MKVVEDNWIIVGTDEYSVMIDKEFQETIRKN